MSAAAFLLWRGKLYTHRGMLWVLMLTMLGAIAAFERDLMLERQREGVAKAKSEGKYKGRVPTAQRQASDVLKLRADGVRAADIAGRLGIGRASVYRVLKEATVP